jgi:hypothetical protein
LVFGLVVDGVVEVTYYLVVHVDDGVDLCEVGVEGVFQSNSELVFYVEFL